MATQRVSANAITALKEALSSVFWFKKDLRDYASAAVSGDPRFLAGIDWTGDQLKRDSVSQFVDRLVRAQDHHQEILIGLMVDVAGKKEFPHLDLADERDEKVRKAQDAVRRLRDVIEPYEVALMREQEAKERIDIEAKAAEARRASAERILELKADFEAVLAMAPQARGYALEKLLADVFEAFDLDPRGSFRTEAEQIDGGFTLDSEHFLLEAKWQDEPTARDDLDIFEAKVNRKGENTLGLFLSINGFARGGVEALSGQGSSIMLMDGADLYAVLEGRVDLRDLLRRKRKETSMTGRIMLGVGEILSGSA